MVEKLGSESFFFTFFPLLPNPFPASLLLLQPTNVQARGAPAITKPLIRSHSTWSTCFHLSQRLHDPDLIPPSWAIHFPSALCLKLRPSHYLLVLCFLTHIVKSFETSPPSQMMHRTTVKPDFLFFYFSFLLNGEGIWLHLLQRQSGFIAPLYWFIPAFTFMLYDQYVLIFSPYT